MSILFISPWFPYPLSNGSKIRIYYLLSSLARKHEVDLISFVRDHEEIDYQGIDSLLRSVTTVQWQEYKPNSIKAWAGFINQTPRYLVDTYNPEMAQLINTTIQEKNPALILASQIATARYLIHIKDVPKIFEEVELGIFNPNQAKSRNFHSFRQSLTWKKIKHYIGKTVHHYSACTVASQVEENLLKECTTSYSNIHVIPNGVDCQKLQFGMVNPQPFSIIYNGALTYKANFDAVSYFLSEIYPLIRQHIPEVQFYITGSTKDIDLKPLRLDSSIHLTGYLSDIWAAVASSSVCVTPIQAGGGTRLKILEAMALGTPVVSTSKGAEGIQATHEKNILIEDNPQGFAGDVIRLLQDQSLRTYIALNARKLVEELYCWDAITRKFVDLVDQFTKES